MEKGLTHHEALEKQKEHGKNEIATTPAKTPLALFLSQFPTFLNGVLASAAIISVIIGDLVDGAFIFAILILNAIFGFIQEYRAEKALEKLKNLIMPISRVIREGTEHQLPSSELVPEDIVVLSEGDRIPADGLVTYGNHVEVDESILTGESLSVIKSHQHELFGGTLITKGKCHMQVKAIGMKTRFGQIAQTLSSIEADKTPLQKKLDTLSKVLSVVCVVVAISLLPIGLAQQKPLIPLLLLIISVAIAAIPEGLPAVITIALAFGTNRMAKRKAIVRKMPAVETLGSVQVILFDKTGTITQNLMTVKKHWLTQQIHLPLFLQTCIVGNTASLIQKNTNDFDVVGDKTDGALLVWATKHFQENKHESLDGKIVDEYVFDEQAKMFTTVWEHEKKKYILVKGAPEEVLKKCKVIEKEKEDIQSLIHSYAQEGLRVIGFAAKHETNEKHAKRSEYEMDLNFLGIVGIYDPPRPEARNAILNAKRAGIIPIMVTGDNPVTATAIAQDIGLLEKDEDVVTGKEMQEMSDEEIKAILLKTRVFARTTPEDKLRLVNISKAMGFVTAVTGDGVNDALALKRADVGVAMGAKGTDVAKEASDIVLTDDNFATLVGAVEEGRTIYSNILKSITYLLSGNLTELSLVFFAAVLGLPAPLLPTQILWINLVTDGLPALALATDTKTPHVLSQAPRDAKIPILTRYRLLLISSIGFGLAALLLIIFNQLLFLFPESQARTITFNLLVAFHLFIVLVVRGKGAFKFNSFLLYAIIITALMQISVNTIPFLQNVLHLTP